MNSTRSLLWIRKVGEVDPSGLSIKTIQRVTVGIRGESRCQPIKDQLDALILQFPRHGDKLHPTKILTLAENIRLGSESTKPPSLRYR